MDDSATTNEAGRWLSYAELAEWRGITRKAAIRLTQRHQWRRQPGNDGATRVFVPANITSRQTPRDGVTLAPPPTPPSQEAFETALAAIEASHAAEVAALRAQVDTSEQVRIAMQALADQAMAQLADAGERADVEIATLRENVAQSVALIDGFRSERDQAQRALEGERARAAALRDRLDAAEAQVAAAEAAAELARRHAQEVQDAAEAARRADDAWKARGRWARLRAVWRGE